MSHGGENALKAGGRAAASRLRNQGTGLVAKLRRNPPLSLPLSRAPHTLLRHRLEAAAVTLLVSLLRWESAWKSVKTNVSLVAEIPAVGWSA